jgi:hypothetical protein
MPSSFGSLWTRFWHTPLRAERLACTRILLGIALLTDQLFQYLPHFGDFFGPGGVAPAGLHDRSVLSSWHWTILFFNTDNLAVLYPAFGVWMAITVAFILGWHTRLMTVLLWLATQCFINRNPIIHNYGDKVLAIGLFLLLWAPSGRAFSLDSLRARNKWRKTGGQPATEAPLTPAWPVRLFQIQLCTIYLTTALAKLLREDLALEGSWWDGTSLHYVLNNFALARWSYAQLPLPFWLTAPLTYVAVWWELLFTPLILNRWTRKWALWFGILFHVGIFLVIEVGWFSFYCLTLYGVWIPDRFWERLDKRGSRPAVAGKAEASVVQPEPLNRVTTNQDRPSEKV